MVSPGRDEARSRALGWCRRQEWCDDDTGVSEECVETGRSWIFCTVGKDGEVRAGEVYVVVCKRYGSVEISKRPWREFVRYDGLLFRILKHLSRLVFGY